MIDLPMIDFTNQVFVRNEQEDDTSKCKAKGLKGMLFPNRSGFGWTILRSLATITINLSQLIIALVFFTFYISAMIFFISNILSMSLEMITSTESNKHKQATIYVGMGFLTICLFINACVILSLFWMVVKFMIFNLSMKVSIFRVCFVLCVVIGTGIWVSVDDMLHLSLAEYASVCAKLSWCFAGLCSVAGIPFFLKFMFTERMKSKAFLVIFVFLAVFGLMWACLVVGLSSAASLVWFLIIIPVVMMIFVTIIYLRGNTTDEKGLLLNTGVCMFFFGVFVIVVLSTLYLTSTAGCTGGCRDSVTTKLLDMQNRTSNSALRYSICESSWTNQKIKIAELAFMVNLTYNKVVDCGNAPIVAQMVNDFFQNRSLQWNVSIYTKSERKVVHFQHQTTHIIAIKGPVTTKEFARDAKLWHELGVFKAVGSILPFIEHLPNDFISQFVSHSSFVAKLFQDGSNSNSFRELEQFITCKTINKQQNDVLLVGHSLAGGLAEIIGARQQIPSVSFSSPGIAHSHVKFEFSQEDALKTAVSISPENDVYSMLDKNAGIEQRIKCDEKVSRKCHLIPMTYCELHNVCGQGSANCTWMMDN